jgi:hypothetical protein
MKNLQQCGEEFEVSPNEREYEKFAEGDECSAT